MPELERDKATICVANYRTLELTRLCLRSIRKFTTRPYEVMVVDNGSADESLAYLKSLGWIRLLERTSANDPTGAYSHGAALQLGLERCETEFFVTMHSDTFVKRDNWLGELLGYFGMDERIACVGSDKIELGPRWRAALKKATDFQTFRRKLLRTPDPIGEHRYWNRTICCVYRTGILKREKLSFLAGTEQDQAPGKRLYFDLVDRGYKTVELPSPALGEYVIHLAHATQATNPAEFPLPERTMRKYQRLAEEVMKSELVRGLLADDGMDR